MNSALNDLPEERLLGVLNALSIGSSTWYYTPVQSLSDRRRRRGTPIPLAVEKPVIEMAELNPRYAYMRIAVMCRRGGDKVSDRRAYRVMREHGRLQKRKKSRQAELYRASKLYELLPQRPNELWQMDVTYVHIPGFGWWYAVTLIDYFSRYLPAIRLTWSYKASEVIKALKEARQETERVAGPLEKDLFLVTDNRSSFIAKRFVNFVKEDFCHVRIQYRTPTQLVLLEPFHEPLKSEEVYWRSYESPEHARECLAEFRERYNHRRPRWALRPTTGGDPYVPAEVFIEKEPTNLPRWQGWARAVKEELDSLLAEAS